MDEFDDFDEPPPCREGGSRPFDYFCSYSYAAHAVWKLNDLGVRFAFEASMLSKDAGAAAEWAALAFKRLQSLHLHGEAGDMAEKHLRDYVVWRLAATLLRRPQGGAWHALTWGGKREAINTHLALLLTAAVARPSFDHEHLAWVED